jgi:signal transduction histidine kinase
MALAQKLCLLFSGQRSGMVWLMIWPGFRYIHRFNQVWFTILFQKVVHITLVSPDRTVVYSNNSDEIGKKITRSKLDDGVVLSLNNEVIGWLLLTPVRRTFTANTPEGIFLGNLNRATLLSAFVAVLLALLLGGALAFTMTRSLRELTEATVEIARGRFGKKVKVRSRDEIGELAAFNRMSQDLDQATRTRQQMTADIAHDLRSPLSVITGYAEALSDNKLPAPPKSTLSSFRRPDTSTILWTICVCSRWLIPVSSR